MFGALDTEGYWGAGLENSDGASDITCSYYPNQNFSGQDFAYYRVRDQQGDTTISSRIITLNVEGEDDPPVFCQISGVDDAPECRGGRCLGHMSPIGKVTPYSHRDDAPVFYYQQVEGTCWRSNGVSIESWEKVSNSMIRPVVSPEGTRTIINNLFVSEGGVGDFEQQVVLTNLTITPLSGDNDLINEGNFKFLYNGNFDTYDGGKITLDLMDDPEDDTDHYSVTITHLS